LLIVIGLMAAPWHLYAAFGDAADLMEVNANGWIILGVALGTLVGLAAALVPLRIGRRALERMEF
jgi:hypothetical protein